MSAPDPTAAAPAPPAAGAGGCIITFYSYKGGTGRTMALANVACALGLAQPPQASAPAVLVVDWDLEAPGLHRFFPARRRTAAPGLGLDEQPGLIDLLGELQAGLPETPAADEDEADARVRLVLDRVDLDRYLAPTDQRGVWMLRAGRDDDGGYSRRVNTFDWEALFQRAPTLYRALGQRLAQRFAWVLVDSRTGVTDISGICTSLLPDKLVVVFTPNRQSLSGVRELVARALAYRRNSDDLRPLTVYPLPSRIEASLEEQRRDWRIGNAEAGIAGFQPVFEELFRDGYGLPRCDLGPYFDAVQIQQTPDCAYGEVISVRETDGDRFSLARSYRVFVERLSAPVPPWEPLSPATPQAAHPAAPAPRAAPDPFEALATPPSPPAAPARREDATVPPARRPAPAQPPMPARGPQVFVSYASQDRSRVHALVQALQDEGLQVWWDRESLLSGSGWRRQIESELDGADVVLALWSEASVNSDFVQEEAAEGLRRGVLLPALLDDVTPPLLFRGVQALSLVRAGPPAYARLADAARRIAARDVGDRTVIIAAPALRPPPPELEAAPMAAPRAQAPRPGPLAPSAPAGRGWWLAGVAGLAVALGLGAMLVGRRQPGPPTLVVPAPAPPVDPAPPTPVPTAVVPDVTRLETGVAVTRLRAEGLEPRLVEKGQLEERDQIDGVVVAQQLAAGTVVAAGTRVRLTVATQTTRVPDVRGRNWAEAQKMLRAAQLVYDATPQREVDEMAAGRVLRIYPAPGERVATDSPVQVTLSAGPAPPSAPAKK